MAERHYTIQCGNGWLKKMASLWTDGKTAKRHLLHREGNISDNVGTRETSDMFTTQDTISSGGVVLDYTKVVYISMCCYKLVLIL